MIKAKQGNHICVSFYRDLQIFKLLVTKQVTGEFS